MCEFVKTMASRDGATVDGTDGSDFSHRERVVSQYYTRYFEMFLAHCFYLQPQLFAKMAIDTEIGSCTVMISEYVPN